MFLIGVSAFWLFYSQAIFATPLSIDKWKPGHYVKIEDWQLMDDCVAKPTTCHMEKIYKELKDTPALRGVKIILYWSRYESRAGGTSTYDFSALNTIINNIKNTSKSGTDKHVILSFAWRVPSTDLDTVKLLVPNDMQVEMTNTPIYDQGGPLEHTTFWDLYAYKQGSSVKGYNIKLYKSSVITRIDAFLQELADEFDDDNVLVQIAATESAIGEPAVPYGTGTANTPSGTNLYGTEAKQYEGQDDVLNSMNTHFVKTPVVPALNYSRPYVATWASGGGSSLLASGKFGLGTPDAHLGSGINYVGTNPGVLTYFPGFTEVILLAPEVQPDHYESDQDTPPIAFPSYESIYERLRDDLYANYIIWQRNYPYWLGKSTPTVVPSVLEFLQTHSDITSDVSGAGGLNTTVPTYLK
jgi:hypothetical protein